MIIPGMMSFINPTISFKPLPKDFKGIFPFKGKEYVHSLAALGNVVIKGKMKMEGAVGDSTGDLKAIYGRNGNELMFVGSVPR